MRKNETDKKQEIINRIKITVIMSLGSLIITVIILLLVALLIEGEIIPAETAKFSSEIVIILTTFIAAATAVKILPGKTLISGSMVSAATLIILLLGSLMFKGRGEPSAVIIAGCTIAGVTAGMIGGRKRKIK